MTDKQIIIDGCDVSGCSLYEDNPKYRMWGTCDCMRSMVDQSGYDELAGAECKGYNCYFKQLKRKEQECEELKEEALHSDYGIMKNNLEGAITYLEKENKDLSKIIDCKNGTVLSLKQQLDQLKLENEHLSEKEEEAKHYLEEAEKFKNCLTEIKEIAKQEIDSKEFMIVQCMLNGNVDDKNKVLKQILQKISEVEEQC